MFLPGLSCLQTVLATKIYVYQIKFMSDPMYL